MPAETVLPSNLRTYARSVLRPIEGEDFEIARRLEFSALAEERTSWRQVASMEPPDDYGQGLLAGTLCMRTVVRVDKPIALVSAYDWSPRNGTVSVAATRLTLRPSPYAVVGVGLFIAMVFADWPIRILRLEGPSSAVVQFQSVSSLGFSEVARLDGYFRTRIDTYEDRISLELTAEDYAVAFLPNLSEAVDRLRPRDKAQP